MKCISGITNIIYCYKIRMDSVIREWLKQITKLQVINNSNYPPKISDESFSYSTKPFNIEIGEIDTKDIDVIELDPDTRLCAGIDEINEKTQLHGYGCLTLKNGDYFKGDFFGSISDREGELIRLSDAGSAIEGTWRNGRAEVSRSAIIVFENISQ